MSHVEHLVHLLPIRSAFFLYGTEQRGHGEHVVLDNATVVAHEIEHFGLRAAGAMHHSMYRRAKLVEHPADYRRVGTRRRKHELSGIHWRACYGVGKAVAAAINEFFGHGLIVTLGIFLSKILGKYIVSGRS